MPHSPLTVDEQQEFQRLYGESKAVETNLAAAADWVERETNHAVHASERVSVFDAWKGEFILWPVPLVSVASVTYIDGDGEAQTVEPSLYSVDADVRPGRIRFKQSFTRPALGDVAGPIRVTHTVGYPELAGLPMSLAAAVRILASHLYENRHVAAPVAMHEVPMGARRLLELHRYVRVEGD